MMTLKAPYARMTNRTAQLRLRGCGICVASREASLNDDYRQCCSWSGICEGAMRRFRWQRTLKHNVSIVSCCWRQPCQGRRHAPVVAMRCRRVNMHHGSPSMPPNSALSHFKSAFVLISSLAAPGRAVWRLSP